MKEIDKSEDIKNNFPYIDILYLEHPTSKKHPRQPIESRAGQFSPFAALTGYDSAVKETERITSQEIELENEEKEKLDQTINIVLSDKEKYQIKIKYFVKDKNKTGGEFFEIATKIDKVDTYKGIIITNNNIKIPLKDIVNIDILDNKED